MFRFDAEKSVHFCDGMRRRDFLHAGSLALLGLGLRGSRNAQGRRARRSDTGRQLHHADAGRRPEPPRYLGHEARRAGRDPRSLQGDSHQRRRHPDQRNLPAHGEARGQIRAAPIRVSPRRRRPRRRPPVHADGPLLPVRQRAAAFRSRAGQAEGTERGRAAARAAAAADRQHRRQSAARPERRFPRQDLRPVRAQRRPVGPGLPGARPAVARLPAADARRRPGVDAAAGRQGGVAPRVGSRRAAARQQLPLGVSA